MKKVAFFMSRRHAQYKSEEIAPMSLAVLVKIVTYMNAEIMMRKVTRAYDYEYKVANLANFKLDRLD